MKQAVGLVYRIFRERRLYAEIASGVTALAFARACYQPGLPSPVVVVEVEDGAWSLAYPPLSSIPDEKLYN